MSRTNKKFPIFLVTLLLLVAVPCESFVLGLFRSNSIQIKGTGKSRFSSDDSNTETQSQPEEKIEMKTWNPFRLAVLKAGFTEPMWSSPLNFEKRSGVYLCAFCGTELFDSSYKYDSGSGWPSFWRSEREGSIDYKREFDGRLECRCSTCKSHLGHVFPDGPLQNDPSISKLLMKTMPKSDPMPVSSQRLPRFCVNGASIKFLSRE